MNIVLGFLICLMFISFSAENIETIEVDSVIEQSSVADFLQKGDRVVSINGSKINIKRDIDFAMQQNGEKEYRLVIERNGKKMEKSFMPFETKYTDGTPAYIIGFIPKAEKANIFNVTREAFFQTIWMGRLVFLSIGMLISGQAGMSDVSGPIGVVDAMNTTAQAGGFVALLYLAGFISVNIGLMNLLPVPALDGGRIFFVLIEAVRKKPIPPEKEGVVHFIGLILLVGLMVFATWNDIVRIIKA